MSPLRIELFNDAAGTWHEIGLQKTGDIDGSISDNHAFGRDVYIFGVDPIENQGYIKKLPFGVDIESGQHRSINPAGTIDIAALQAGESHEMTFRTDKSPQPRKLRFTYTEDD